MAPQGRSRYHTIFVDFMFALTLYSAPKTYKPAAHQPLHRGQMAAAPVRSFQSSVKYSRHSSNTVQRSFLAS
jgi:hypothetical protein